MNRLLLIGIILIALTACSQMEAAPSSTTTPEFSIPEPTAANTPLPPNTLEPTSIPEPFKMENGQLLVYNEQTGVYDIGGGDVDDVKQVGDGLWLVRDSDGLVLLAEQSKENSNDVKLYPWVFDASESISVFTGDEGLKVSVDGQLYAYNLEGQEWEVVEVVEVPIPEGAENHIRETISGRITTIVVDGKAVEGPESEFEVLINPDTNKYEWRLNVETGEWEKYVPQIFVVGESSGLFFDVEVPRKVVETAAETMKNAVLFQRVDGEQMIEVKTGLHEQWGVTENSDGQEFMHWYGVLLGAKESSDRVHGYIGVNLNNDILVIDVGFDKTEFDFSTSSVVFVDSIIQDYKRGIMDTNLGELEGSVDGNQIARAILNSDAGIPMYFVTMISDHHEEEKRKVLEALESGEFLRSNDLSVWSKTSMGASSTFWELAESQ